MKIPDPLDINRCGIRILSDKVILAAIDAGFISIDPKIDFSLEKNRLQPSTLDVKLDYVDEFISRRNNSVLFNEDELILPAHSECVLNLTEKISFEGFGDYNHKFIFPSVEGRSSVRRPGGYVLYMGNTFIDAGSRSQIELGNYSCNNIVFEKNERIGQVFFKIDPFLDKYYFNYEDKKLVEIMDFARSLEMGVEINSDDELKSIVAEKYLDISPSVISKNGFIAVRASDKAYRMKKLEDSLVFSKRDEYSNDDLLEPIDISNGYKIMPKEHIIIETIESFDLSSHVGIRFWDNLLGNVLGNINISAVDLFKNIDLINLSDGWIDPGYVGGFSRQPKWNSPRFVRPGDIIGYGQVFFYPKGTKNMYGDKILDSQYNNKREIAFSN
ncbi:hypothetical protein K9L67_05760 [Candidatus Woesearchaeota archaeon]|nr:hypothetical protein [Candidatus Woesearchaeota archaeon]MCF8013003.1 hypothetical protein [Candidatus Woesearchaeota archaeon]